MQKFDDSDFLRPLYRGIYKKLGQFFFHTYLLTCVDKDTSVLLKSYKPLNKLISQSIKTMFLTLLLL